MPAGSWDVCLGGGNISAAACVCAVVYATRGAECTLMLWHGIGNIGTFNMSTGRSMQRSSYVSQQLRIGAVSAYTRGSRCCGL